MNKPLWSKTPVKKTVLSAYSHIRVTGVKAIKLDDDDELIAVRASDGSKEVMISSAHGQATCLWNPGVPREAFPLPPRVSDRSFSSSDYLSTDCDKSGRAR